MKQLFEHTNLRVYAFGLGFEITELLQQTEQILEVRIAQQ